MKKRFLLIIVSLLIIAAVITGCSSISGISTNQSTAQHEQAGNPATADVSQNEYAESLPNIESDDGFAPNTGESVPLSDIADQMGSKIIKSGYMSIETVKFEETTSAITRKVQQAGGFIASSNVQGWSKEEAAYKPLRRANYRIRIPGEKFEQFMTDVGEMGNVTTSETWGEDVTDKYFDTEARLKSLTMQEERLLTLLSKAEQLSDIIEIERELSSVRYQIESLTGTLRKYDNLVAYSTLEIDVVEVEEFTGQKEKPDGLWDKIVYTLKNSIKGVAKLAEGLLLFLVAAIPYVLLFGFAFIMIFALVKFIRKQVKYKSDNFKEQKKQDKEDENNE